MADQVSYAIQDGRSVKVYNDRKGLIFSKMGELSGYTANTVTIKDGRSLKVYNSKGALITTKTV